MKRKPPGPLIAFLLKHEPALLFLPLYLFPLSFFFISPLSLSFSVCLRCFQGKPCVCVCVFSDHCFSVSSEPPETSPVSSAMIISFEVIFSISIFGIITACYFIGLRRRKARESHHQDQVERALARHLVHSSSSTLPPPPCYAAAPTESLSPTDVSRLDYAMSQHYLLPRYADLVPSSSSFIQTPPVAFSK